MSTSQDTRRLVAEQIRQDMTDPVVGNSPALHALLEAEHIDIPRVWEHSRKGRITGQVVWQDDTWMHVRLVGDHQLRYFARGNQGYTDEDGSVITVRRSFMTEVV